MDTLCPQCGRRTPYRGSFCIECGARLREPAESSAVPAETESPQDKPVLTSLRPSAFLVAGVLLVVLAQYVFITTDTTDRFPPLTGAGALLAGILVFATGSYLYHARQPERAASLSHTPADIPLAVPSRPLLVWGVGALLASLLIVRLLTGSQSPWDLLLWVLALGAFALPFLPNLRLPEWRGAMQAFQRIRYDALIVAGLVAFFVAVNARDLNAWYYSIIGDEYVFWENARIILDNGLFRPFDQAGVHREHPVLNVAFKSFVMLFAGQNHFGITFSSVLAGAASIPGVYLLGHTVGRGRTAAIIATALFSFSHYIFAFVHIQYISVDGMIPAVYAFGFLVLGIRQRSPLLLYLAGVVAGLGFYTFLPARAIMPIILLFLLLSPRPHKAVLHAWPLILGFLAAALPAFIVNGEQTYAVMFDQLAPGYDPNVVGPVGERIRSNVASLFAFNYNIHVSHYVSGSLLDAVSAMLAVLGVGYALGSFRNASSRLLLIWFAVALVGAALFAPHWHTPHTRMHFVLPPLVLMAGIMASSYLWPLAASTGSRVRLGIPRTGAVAALTATLLLVVLALNVRQFWVVTPLVMEISYEATAIGALRSEACRNDLAETLFVGDGIKGGLRTALESYHPNGPTPRILDHPEWELGVTLADEPTPRCTVLVNPYHPDADSIAGDLEQRYPDGDLMKFSDRSGRRTVFIFTFPEKG